MHPSTFRQQYPKAKRVPQAKREPKPKREPEIILSDVRALAEDGAGPRAVTMMQRHRPLFQEAVKHFGSWPAAIEAAGLVIVPRRLKDRALTRESVLSKLLELSTVTDPLQGTKVKGHPGCSSLPKWDLQGF